MFVANLSDFIKLYASIALFHSPCNIFDLDISFNESKPKQC